MANTSLFISTLVCIVIHAFAAWYYDASLFMHAYYGFGLATSFGNHGTAVHWLRVADRVTMILFWCTDFAFGAATGLILIAGLSYLASKACQIRGCRREPLHMVAHAAVTLAHIAELQRIRAAEAEP